MINSLFLNKSIIRILAPIKWRDLSIVAICENYIDMLTIHLKNIERNGDLSALNNSQTL
jgi:hypothetical protein